MSLEYLHIQHSGTYHCPKGHHLHKIKRTANETVNFQYTVHAKFFIRGGIGKG